MWRTRRQLFDVAMAARAFSNKWMSYTGNERGGYQKFWISLYRDVFGVEDAADEIEFEKPVKIDDTTKSIDGYIASTHVLIEQKAPAKATAKAFDQALNYAEHLDWTEKATKIVTCNFNTLQIYTTATGDVVSFFLTDLANHLPELADLMGIALPSF